MTITEAKRNAWKESLEKGIKLCRDYRHEGDAQTLEDIAAHLEIELSVKTVKSQRLANYERGAKTRLEIIDSLWRQIEKEGLTEYHPVYERYKRLMKEQSIAEIEAGL